MSHAVYFDSSVFLDIFRGNDIDGSILALLKELKRKKAKIHTSIITIEEVSVDHFRKGKVASANYSKVHKFAMIEGINQDIALTTAKLEAALLDSSGSLDDQQKAAENKRRRWDMFHIATAMCYQCGVFYTTDEGFAQRQKRLGITSIVFLPPKPENLPLELRDSDEEAVQTVIPTPPEIRGSNSGHPQDQAGTKAAKAEKAQPPEIPAKTVADEGHRGGN